MSGSAVTLLGKLEERGPSIHAPKNPPATASLLAALSDADLLQCVALRALDPRRAQAAQAEFYARHVRYLYGVLRRQERLLALARETAEDLVQETFDRAFEHARSFRADADADVDQARRRTRAWLGRIAERLLADALSRTREVAWSPDLDEPGCGSDEVPSSSPRVRRTREALEQLSEREQDVLRVTALYHRVGSEHQRLPNAVVEELAARWKISHENVRAIRSRALRRLRSLLTEQVPVVEEQA